MATDINKDGVDDVTGLEIDDNKDGRNDVTGKKIATVGVGAGASVSSTNTPNLPPGTTTTYTANATDPTQGTTVTNLGQAHDGSGAWYPKYQTPQPYFSTGAISQTIDAMSDPNSAFYNEAIKPSDLNGSENLPNSSLGIFEVVAKGRKSSQSASTVMNSFIATSEYYNAHGIRITPQQLAYQEAMDNGWITDTGQTNLPSDPATSPYRGPTKTFNITNAGDAEYTLNQMMAGYLGRQVKPEEVAQFKQHLNAVEMQNPTVSTPMGDHASVVTGGSNANVEARDFAMSRGDYAETQASTTLMGWLTNAIRSSGSERIV